MSDESSTLHGQRRWLLALAALSTLAVAAACDKAREPAITPATVVMPSDTASASANPLAATDTGGTSATTQPVAPAPVAPGSPPGGSVSVIGGPADTAASAPAANPPVPRASVPMSAGLPAPSASVPISAGLPAPSASLPGAGSIGPVPASSPSGEQPPSVSPGTRS